MIKTVWSTVNTYLLQILALIILDIHENEIDKKQNLHVHDI